MFVTPELEDCWAYWAYGLFYPLLQYLPSSAHKTLINVFDSTTDKPKIDESPEIAKSASDKGQTGKLICRATGAPDITFTWSRLGRLLHAEAEGSSSEAEDDSNKKYEIKTKMIDR